MRYYTLAFSLICLFTACALNNYTQLWNRVDVDAEGEKAAKHLQIVKSIYRQALKSGDLPNQARAGIMIARLTGKTSDNRETAECKILDSLILLQKGSVKALLLSRKARILDEFQNNNTNEQRGETDDIRKWRRDHLEKEATAAYLASVKDTAILQHELLASYTGLLLEEKENRFLRPTLYDLLAHRALSYFNRNTRLYKNILDTINFAPAAIFATGLIKDSADHINNSLEIYRRLIRFHTKRNNIEALVYADIERLDFVKDHSSLLNKELLYEQAMEQLQHKYANSKIGTHCTYELADHYYTKAGKARDTTTCKMLYSKAMSLCMESSRIFTSSEGSKNCQVLKSKMLMKKLSIEAESVNEPGKPFRMLVNYRNINNMHIRLIRVDQSFNFNYVGLDEEEKKWSTLLGLPVQKSWQQPLHDPLDFTEHFVEIKVDALETGKYMLIASSDKNFDFNTSRLAAQLIQVSNISYITMDEVNFYVLHRSTGEPLKGVKLLLKEDKEELTFTTNDDGHIHIKYEEGWYADPVSTWINGTDTLRMNDPSFYARNIDNAIEEETREGSIRSYYYADRRIYRPGQTICFKGIRTEGESHNNRLVTNAQVKVWLRDNNNRKIDSLSLRTNAFGSYTGTFKLPPNLTGSFSISDDGHEGSLYVFVEEYKRPKFEVLFDSVKATYRLYDSVRITGHAIAFSGNNLSNAKVKWRVAREESFYLDKDYSLVYDPESVIWSETTTDVAGNFDLAFLATSNRSKEDDPHAMFYYTITADITDANGETRTGTYKVQVGYQTMVLYTTINDQIKLPQLSSIGIASRNTNGAFIPIPVNITFTRLNHPGRLMRERYWKQPDQFVMTEKEYHQYFPLDIYKDENDPSTWSKGKVYKTEGITSDGKKWDLSKMGLSAGTYEVLITGEDATKKQIVQIVSKETNTDPAYTWYFDHDRILQPGDVAHIALGASGNTWLLQRDDKVAIHKLNGTLAKIDIPIKEADRGNRSLAFAYVKDNRLFTYDCTLKVPWSNKQLDISIAAHRNKILPGAKETWSLTVKAPGNKIMASELTATMYDASLDEISFEEWEVPPFYEARDKHVRWNGELSFSVNTSSDITTEIEPEWIRPRNFDRLAEAELYEHIYGDPNGVEMIKMSAPVVASYSKVKSEATVDNAIFKVENSPGLLPPPSSPRPRKDFRETVFFIPQLQVNGQGSITFTMPEALTKWNFRAFAHTKDLKFGLATSQVITQKPLMVTPNAPRFLREGDNVELSTKISNVTNAQLTGKVKLELLDPDNMQPLDKQFSNILPTQNFNAAGGQSTAVTFHLKVPQGYTKPLIYRFTAESGKFTDGEEALLPVLSNRILVTESMPIYIRGNGKKDYTFEKLLHSSNSPTLQHQGITVTYNSNPIWYAIQSLPYLMEFPHECAEQTFSRYYANAVATQILKSTPKVHAMIKRLSVTNLEKDAELKSALLEETPWVKEAQAENHLAALLDLQKMSLESDKAFKQLQAMQLPNGAFPWFGGMHANDYITQHILTGIGRLKMMKVPVPDGIVEKALHYLDSSRKKDNMLDLHYLYMRSFFPNAPSNKGLEKNWQKQSVYAKGMIALILFRNGNITTAKKIMQDLKENATQSEDMGMYWTSEEAGYYWYEAPVETQSLLIEAFTTITQDQPTVDALKTWLLRQKQTNSWSTTRSTADACYALLMNGTEWLNTTPETKITIGEETLSDKDGIIKTRMEGKKVNAKMAKVELNVKGNGTQSSWGSVYWQYFEQLDKITPSKSGLSVQRELYLGNTRISATQALHVGDKVTMRIILKADRNMEFVHLKDMRPACLEPIDVLSEYRNGYYQSTKDLATHFFFDRVGKGTHVLEYSLFVSHAGNYAGGISTAQCMYAPEFNANSAGMNVVVE